MPRSYAVDEKGNEQWVSKGNRVITSDHQKDSAASFSKIIVQPPK